MLWFPYAKINLGLAVLNKRSDGFHNIESLLHPIKLFDILEIIECDSDSYQDELSITGLSLDIHTKENLVWKSLELLRSYFDFPFIKIHLHKQIPIGAGLGGGSSDAAHTLLGINQLFQLNISDSTLVELASQIGSDCSFFINPYPQYAKGRGEILESLKINLNALKLLLVIPEFTISTKIAYKKIKTQTHRFMPIETLVQPINNWKSYLTNDFEEIIFDEFPILSDLKEKIYLNGAIYASLSGSGSVIYALFSEKIEIELPENYKHYWMDFTAYTD
ncbi:MAG: 4-(cytidine 5'-diphospho)-2-C-methyl-D-erythritol kinase [Bacteroidales bacterium]|jgi:4-diphosphocytidyl-2-C-methyl-D-erythritol kinase|nr:4-(cytidine 5'-diphospho)-2-C-methyl-D-erythritol kinase [Bacteroidales bacterium]